MNEDVVRRALQLVADDVDGYPVLEPALRTARRTRLLKLATAPVAVALVVAGVLLAALPPGAVRPAPAEPSVTPTELRLPDPVPRPGFGTPSIVAQPPGPVPVVISGSRLPLTGLFGSKAMTVSPAGLRALDWSLDWPVHAGENLLLSPDGSQLAWDDGLSLHVLDLRTGLDKSLPTDGPRQLLAWSPDGTELAFAKLLVSDNPSVQPVWTGIGTSVVADGLTQPLFEPLGQMPSMPGASLLAFSPDMSRIAYQTADGVRVLIRPNLPGATLAMPGAVLAGPGAWTRDGSVVLAVPEECCADRAANTWRLAFYDGRTGANRTVLAFPPVSGATAIRLIGWSPAGEAMVLAYIPKARPGPMSAYVSPTWFDLVDHVDLLALAPGAAEPRLVLRTPGEIEAIDVATDALAASGTVAVPVPPVIPVSWRITAAVTYLAVQVLIAAVILAIVVPRRLRRRLRA